MLIVIITNSQYSLDFFCTVRSDDPGLWPSYPYPSHWVFLKEAFLDKPVEKAGKNDEIMVDSRVGSLTLGSLRAIAFGAPSDLFQSLHNPRTL